MSKPVSYAVVLAGGGGTRLWPSSRRARPKQLLTLGGRESLLAATVRRIEPVFGRDRILIVTARDQERAIRRELPALPKRNILVEPEARNNAGAIQIAAAFAVLQSGPASLLGVLPADAYIADERGFRRSLRAALAHASETIVTVGIKPTAPETGYGYIRIGRALGGKREGAYEVAEFVEKPDHETALRYLRSGRYLWNAGMFFLSAARMRDETARHLPRLHQFFERVIVAKTNLQFKRLVNRHYHEVEAISIDYGVMEHASGLRVVPGDFGWSDIGSWSALGDLARHARTSDAHGNVVIGDALLEEGRNTIVVSDPGAPFVGVLGTSELVVVATSDAVLVIPRSRAQDVRRIVEALKLAKRTELL